jgi:hypothetical protein
VAGKPRLEGARSALEQVGVPHAAERAMEYAAIKQALIDRLIDEGSSTPFRTLSALPRRCMGPGCVLRWLRRRRMPTPCCATWPCRTDERFCRSSTLISVGRMCRAASRTPHSSCLPRKPWPFRRTAAWSLSDAPAGPASGRYRRNRRWCSGRQAWNGEAHTFAKSSSPPHPDTFDCHRGKHGKGRVGLNPGY